MNTPPNTKNVAFLGDYVPSRCSIATFTADICEAVAAEYPGAQCIVGSVNDRPEGYDYPERVRFEIDEQELDSYRRAAEFLNINNVEVVSVQHEFGIYGEPAGSQLLALLREVRMPVVTTAERGRNMLETISGVAPEKIDLDSNLYKDVFGVEGKTELLTFGLLNAP